MPNLLYTPKRVVEDITYLLPQYTGNTPVACGAVNDLVDVGHTVLCRLQLGFGY